MTKISKKWKKHAEVYRFFAEKQCSGLDFSYQAALKAFEYESRGIKSDLSNNGYAVGKHWANVQVDEWYQGVDSKLFTWKEYVEDPEMDSIRWWIMTIIPVDYQEQDMKIDMLHTMLKVKNDKDSNFEVVEV